MKASQSLLLEDICRFDKSSAEDKLAEVAGVVPLLHEVQFSRGGGVCRESADM